MPASFTLTTLAWGVTTTPVPYLVGHDQALGIENRVPGRGREPLPSTGGVIAAGLDDIDRYLTLEAPCLGNA